jgi:hypothetical protein
MPEEPDRPLERPERRPALPYENRIARARDVDVRSTIGDADRAVETGDNDLPDAAAAERALGAADARREQRTIARSHHIDLAELSHLAHGELQANLRAIEARYAENPRSTRAQGDRGEAIALATIKEFGLPVAGGWREIDTVIAGQYDAVHGIDLVAVVDGKPVPIEVKYHQRPTLSDYPLTVFGNEAELPANLEMGDGWIRNRWRALLENPEKRLELARAGLKSSYLSPANFADDTSPAWGEVLSNRRVAVISDRGTEAVNGTIVRQAGERNIPPHHILTIDV